MTPASPFERRPTDLNEAEAQIAAILALLATAIAIAVVGFV